MRYVLRADASHLIGSGHVMRSSAIAEELISRGKNVFFVGQIFEIPWLSKYISGIGFSKIFENELEFVSNPVDDVLILDSYNLPVGNEFIKPVNWRTVVALTDEVTPPYEAQLLIHPAIESGWKPSTNRRFISGPEYIPLRKSIKKNINGKNNQDKLEIIVVGGGTDLYNFVEVIASILLSLSNEFQVSLFTNQTQNQKLDSRFVHIPIGSDLDKKALSADLVFTTASTSSLEFIAREIPIGIGCAVKNQEQYYESLSRLNVAAPIGRYVNGKWEINHSKVKDLLSNFEYRRNLISNCSNIIDLNGAKRIVDKIQDL